MTCWDNPEKCTGCHYCQTARDTGEGVYPLTPLEAHLQDLADADMRMDLSRPLSPATIDAAIERQYGKQVA